MIFIMIKKYLNDMRYNDDIFTIDHGISQSTTPNHSSMELTGGIQSKTLSHFFSSKKSLKDLAAKDYMVMIIDEY